MTVKMGPPIWHMKWNGKGGQHLDAGDWHWPDSDSIQVLYTKDWSFLGWAPKPTNILESVSYHWHHGRLMRIPRRHVVAYILRYLNRRLRS